MHDAGVVAALVRPDGWLFLGAAETTINLDDKFTRMAAGQATFYQAP